MHWLTLRFPDRGLERRYRVHRADMVRLQMRIALFVGCALYLGYGSIELFFDLPSWTTHWDNRLLSVAAPLATSVLTWFPRAFRRSYDVLGAASGIVGMLGVILLVQSVPPATGDAFFCALVLVCVAYYLFIGLGLPAALAANAFVLAMYALLQIPEANLSAYRLYWHLYVLSAANVVGVGSAYLVERQRRQLFVRNRQLTRERDLHRDLARQDRLTGLPNRAHLLDRLDLELARRRRDGQRGAGLFIDLDAFKPVNDRYGHTIGDLVLSELASRMRRTLRAADLVVRLGGDEFFAVLDTIRTREDARRIADLLLVAIAQPLQVALEGGDHVTLRVGASVGVCLFPDQAQTAATIIACADYAMYLAKSTAHGTVAFAPADWRRREIPRRDGNGGAAGR